MAQMGPPRRPGRVGRWVAWLLVVVLGAAIVAGAVLSGRAWIAIAAVAGLVLAWLLARLFRLIRRRPVVGLSVLGVVVLVGLGVLSFAYVTGNNSLSPGPAPGSAVGPVTVRYHGTGQLDGDTIALREEIVVDRDSVAAIGRMLGPLTAADSLGPPTGWQTGTPVDGYSTYTRTRTITPADDSLVSSTASIPLNIGRLSVGDEKVTLLIRTGSRLELTATKGALGATYPNATTVVNDPRRAGNEVTTIDVDDDVVDVSMAVLKGPLRNPAGRQVYDAFVWGPLPWAIGAFFALIASILGDRFKRLLGLAARRAVKAARGSPDGPVAPEAA